MLSGGCFCGRVRYEADGIPFHETSCHCEICRRTSGAPLVTWFSVRRAEFRLVSGTPVRFRSTAFGTRSFCPDCGTQLTFENDGTPDEIDVTMSSLDEPDRLSPKDHTYVRSKLQWLRFADQLPAYEEARKT
ncbi:GFA family protein [Noviherbaspirillum aerium]|uniref:GFA family protein n=1 Tax=Noviherbaspirillum aerium TaxID=2588497 RepID=UPI00124C6442|nr:GFA family protein [Noviherbaspirillum aerium]